MLPKIKISSKQSLPPQCPGRTRNQLHLTVGPVDWNPLHAFKPNIDEKFYVTVLWWGDESDGVELPISTSRQTTTHYSIKRPHKQLQCYLTDMGSLSLTLYDSNDDVIGAAVVPGIKRLSPENSIREIANIRDSTGSYRLGKLPVYIEIRGLRGRGTSGSSRSRSRSNSARRSRSARSRSTSAPRSNSKTNLKKSDKSKTVDLTAKPQVEPFVPAIDALLSKAQTLREQMNLEVSERSPERPQPKVRPFVNLEIPKINMSDVPALSIPAEKSYSNMNLIPNIPANLGQARNLPQITLNIPNLPQLTKPNLFENRSVLREENQNKENIQNYSRFRAPSSAPVVPVAKSRDFNELILGNQLDLNSSMKSVDYVPSEADSLLDEEILDQIYRINRAAPINSPLKLEKSDYIHQPQNSDHWLKAGQILTVRLNDVIIPRKKGRPPPAVTEREIDDSYCIEFTLPWSKGSC